MQVVVGHANPDFDAYAATVAATKVHHGARGVFLGSQNANVRAFHNLHEEFFDFVDLKMLDAEKVDSVIMVDTRDPQRVGELGEIVMRPGVEVIVYDHHPPQAGDVTEADDRSVEVGATTSILVHEIKRRGMEITPLEASLFLLGIHEDTGSLTYPGATAYDADAAAWLMASGADIEVLNQFLSRTLDGAQKRLLAQLESSLELWNVNGQQVAVGVAEADEYVDSASVLTHYVVEDLGYRVAIAIISMPDRMQVVARSRLPEVDVGAVMAELGGGGHAQAASAGFRDVSIAQTLARVRSALTAVVRAPLTARDVMSSPVRTVAPDATMREAGDMMSLWGHGGLPVMENGVVVGLVTRKDVDKSLRHRLDHAPVKGFMGRDVVSVSPETDLSELEALLASRGIGRVPVMEHGALVGIVTRKDVLRSEHGESYLVGSRSVRHPHAVAAFLEGVEGLPAEVRDVVHALGAFAGREGVRAHAVGGFVRDMVMGRPNFDVDVVVEGDGVGFGERAAAELGARVTVHRRFGTAVIVISRTLHVDIASSRAEYYTRPGALPTVERSTLRQDLYRRDFTINAMAACLEPACFGEIADPFGGLRDLETGTLRTLHALSFVEDPTRVLRAARFEVRYGFTMDPQTESSARNAVSLGLLDEVSGARVREELYDILAEEDPVAVLARLHDLGALAAILPAGSDPLRVLEQMREALDSAEKTARGRFSARTLLLTLMANAGARDGVERWLRHYRIGRESAPAALAVAAAAGVERALSDRRGMKDSRLARMLQPLPPESVAALWARGGEVGRGRIEHFWADLSSVRPAVSGQDLIDLGVAPGQSFSAILARARDDRLDGRAVGREAELANLRRLAVRAGLVGIGKDPV